MAEWRDGSECEFDSWKLRRSFRDEFSRQRIASYAEDLLRRFVDAGGSCLMFRNSPGGLVGHAIRTLLVQRTDPSQITDELVRSLMSDFNFTPEWVPPRLLVREALAYAVRIRQVLQRLSEEISGGDDLKAAIDRAAIPLDSTEAAFLLPDVTVDALIKSIR